MADLKTDIVIGGGVDPSVQSSVGALVKTVQTLSTAADDAAKNSALLKAALSDPSNAGKSVDAIARSMASLDDNAKKTTGHIADLNKVVADTSDTAKTAAGNADTLAKSLGDAGEKAKTVSMAERISGVRNFGIGMVAASGAGMLLANSFIKTAEEGNGLEKRLEALFTAQKRLQDLGPVNAGIGDMAERAHLPDDDPLREAVILLGNWETKTKDILPLLEAAERQSETTGQAVGGLANAFGKAVATGNYEGLKRSAVAFSETEEAAIKAGYAISEEAGKLALVNAITAAVARTTGELGAGLTESQKAANDAAREYDTLATAIGTGAGNAKKGIDEWAASALRLVGANKEVAESSGAILYTASLIGGGVGGVVLFGSAVAQGVLAVVELGAAGVTLGTIWASVTAAFATATAAISAWGAAAVASMTAAYAAALPMLVVMGQIVLVALAAAAAMYLVDKALNAKEDAELAANIKEGEGKDKDAVALYNQSRARVGKSQNGTDASGLADTGTSDPTDQIANIQKTLADAQSGKGVAAQSTLPMPSMGAPSSGGFVAPSSGLSVEPTNDEAQADIEQLQEAISTEENTYRKKAMQRELAMMKRDLAKRKKFDADAKRARADALKALGQDSAAAAAERTSELAEQSAQARGDSEIAGFGDKRQLSRDIRAVKGDVKAGRLDKESGESRMQALRDAYAAREAARAADLEMQIAQLDAQKELAEGAARAAGQQGNQAQSTLRIAQARANRILNTARAKSDVLNEEAATLRESANEGMNAGQSNGATQTRELAAALALGRLRGSNSGGMGDGSMFRGMGAASYGGSAMVGTDAARIADGVARANAGMSSFGSGTAAIQSERDSPLTARMKSIARDAVGELVIRFEDLRVADGQSARMRGADAYGV